MQDIRSSAVKVFRDIQVDDSNILIWTGLIVPVSYMYTAALFSVILYFTCSQPKTCTGIQACIKWQRQQNKQLLSWFSGLAISKRWSKPILNCMFFSAGNSTVQQRCISHQDHLSSWVSVQAAEDNISDKNLSPEHWWEGTSVLAHHQCRELEAGDQNRSGLVLKSIVVRCDMKQNELWMSVHQITNSMMYVNIRLTLLTRTLFGFSVVNKIMFWFIYTTIIGCISVIIKKWIHAFFNYVFQVFGFIIILSATYRQLWCADISQFYAGFYEPVDS